MNARDRVSREGPRTYRKLLSPPDDDYAAESNGSEQIAPSLDRPQPLVIAREQNAPQPDVQPAAND